MLGFGVKHGKKTEVENEFKAKIEGQRLKASNFGILWYTPGNLIRRMWIVKI